MKLVSNDECMLIYFFKNNKQYRFSFFYLKKNNNFNSTNKHTHTQVLKLLL